jgi:hypothetical protein
MSNVVTLPPRHSFDLNDAATLKLDLTNPRPKDVVALVETFTEAMKANPDLGPLPVHTGWNEITPEIGINLLKRNHPGANRRVDPATVFYYANQMARNDWKATGQPVLIDAKGTLQDAQHRLLAGLISGVTFKSYVVTDIEPVENLFAYIDNSRPRTSATALQTAGYNGVAPTIVKVIKISEEIKHGIYNPGGMTRLMRFYPADVLRLIGDYPNAQRASRSAASDWSDAVKFLDGRKDIVAWLGMRIADLHNEYLADDFFEDVADMTTERPAEDPILALHKLIDKDNRAEKQMKRHHVLAALIKVFNAWHKHEPLGRRWMLQVDENFPALEEGTSQTEAAE